MFWKQETQEVFRVLQLNLNLKVCDSLLTHLHNYMVSVLLKITMIITV